VSFAVFSVILCNCILLLKLFSHILLEQLKLLGLPTQVSLTWDETPHERVSFMACDFSKDELADQDLQNYVASDTDSEGMMNCVHWLYVYLLFLLLTG